VVKGFRPGKEPPELREKRAKARLGEDASWAQKKMIETVGDRTPEEVREMVTRWTRILLAVAVVLVVGGALLYPWSLWAGIAVHVLALGAGFFWFRFRQQRENFVETAEWMRRL